MSPPLKVLLVEDNLEEARLFARLAPRSFVIETVTRAEAARTAAVRNPYDIAFIDYGLGPDNGLEVVRMLRAAAPRTPLILMTSQEVGALDENALLAGATDSLLKATLSPAKLERAARWALIRRHVAHRAGDDSSEAALREALIRTPPPGAKGAGLRRLVYLSRALMPFDPPQLLLLCAQCAAANARIDVSGVLVLAGDCFLQVLEGEPHAIGRLLDRIAADRRHGNLAVVLDEATDRRLYGDWNMGYLHLGERHRLESTAWLQFLRVVGRDLAAIGGNRALLDAFITQLPALLREQAAPSRAA